MEQNETADRGLRVQSVVMRLASYLLVGASCFGFGVCSKRVEIKVPLREGDRVIVKDGFFAGNTGSLNGRRVMYDKTVEYTIKWDNPKCEGGSFGEDEIMLIGGWNSVEPSVTTKQATCRG